MRMVEGIAGASCKGNQTVGIFLDVEKGFDKVWYDGLLFKFREVQLPDCYFRLITSFLTDRTFCMRINNNISSKTYHCGRFSR